VIVDRDFGPRQANYNSGLTAHSVSTACPSWFLPKPPVPVPGPYVKILLPFKRASLRIFMQVQRGQAPIEVSTCRRGSRGPIRFLLRPMARGFEGTMCWVASSMSTTLPLKWKAGGLSFCCGCTRSAPSGGVLDCARR
jgi:hypothetical protein